MLLSSISKRYDILLFAGTAILFSVFGRSSFLSLSSSDPTNRKQRRKPKKRTKKKKKTDDNKKNTSITAREFVIATTPSSATKRISRLSNGSAISSLGDHQNHPNSSDDDDDIVHYGDQYYGDEDYLYGSGHSATRESARASEGAIAVKSRSMALTEPIFEDEECYYPLSTDDEDYNEDESDDYFVDEEDDDADEEEDDASRTSFAKVFFRSSWSSAATDATGSTADTSTSSLADSIVQHVGSATSRFSTFKWIANYLRASGCHVNSGVPIISSTTTTKARTKSSRPRRSTRNSTASYYSTSTMTTTATQQEQDLYRHPINIMCFDGGGVKGMILKVIYNELEESFNLDNKKHKKVPLREQFDLMAGTSIGGIAALFCNHFTGYGEVAHHAAFFGQMITGGMFREKQYLQFFQTGSIFHDNRNAILQYMLGKDRILLNSKSPKAFSVATYCVPKDDYYHGKENHKNRNDHQDKTDASTTSSKGKLRPYLMRTYEAPNEDPSRNLKVANGTCRIKMWEAAAATSAAPVAFDRTRVAVPDPNNPNKTKQIKLADGGLVANDPTELALYEAMALFPGHPIGLVVSIGCGRATGPDVNADNEAMVIEDDTACSRDIATKVQKAGGTYIRLNPVIGNVSFIESSPEKLDELEQTALKYMKTSPIAAKAKELIREASVLRKRQEREQKRQQRKGRRQQPHNATATKNDNSERSSIFSFRSGLFPSSSSTTGSRMSAASGMGRNSSATATSTTNGSNIHRLSYESSTPIRSG